MRNGWGTDGERMRSEVGSEADGDLAQDAAIRAELRAEGREALARHFASVRERLRRIIGFRLNQRLRGRVSESDVLQETFVRAADRMDQFVERGEVPFFVWLRAEAAQRLVELHRFHLQADKRDARREIQLAPVPLSDATSLALAARLAGPMTTPSQVFVRRQQIESLEQSLNTMNPIDREVIALRNFEELSNAETAKVLGISPDSASKRYFRALKRLREIMQTSGLS